MTTNNTIKALKPHISINVSDVGKSVEFYTKLFGVEPVKFYKTDSVSHSIVKDSLGEESTMMRFGYAKFDLENPGLNFVLNEIPHRSGGTLSHLGIQVGSTDDVMAIRQQWIDSGLITVDEMQVACCYAKQDKTWARDPDGNEWEVFVVLENLEPAAENSCGCSGDVAGYVDDANNKANCCSPAAVGTETEPSNVTCCQAN